MRHGLPDSCDFSVRLRMGPRVEDSGQGLEQSMRERGGIFTKDKGGKVHLPVKFLLSSPRSSRQGVRQAGRVVLLSRQEEGNGFWWTAISLCGTMTTLDFVCNLDRFSHPLTRPYST